MTADMRRERDRRQWESEASQQHQQEEEEQERRRSHKAVSSQWGDDTAACLALALQLRRNCLHHCAGHTTLHHAAPAAPHHTGCTTLHYLHHCASRAAPHHITPCCTCRTTQHWLHHTALPAPPWMLCTKAHCPAPHYSALPTPT